jgi:hypothetical protein
MAPVLKTGIPERVSGVRIPPSPPDFIRLYFQPLAAQFRAERLYLRISRYFLIDSRLGTPEEKVKAIR